MQLRTAGGLTVTDITDDVREAVAVERRAGRHLLRLLAAHDLLRAGERVRAGLPRGLRRAAAAARAGRALLRARRLGPAHREHLPRGHGGRQRPRALHVDAARARPASRSRCARASSASAPGSACSSWSWTASATGAGWCRSSASEPRQADAAPLPCARHQSSNAAQAARYSPRRRRPGHAFDPRLHDAGRAEPCGSAADAVPQRMHESAGGARPTSSGSPQLRHPPRTSAADRGVARHPKGCSAATPA